MNISFLGWRTYKTCHTFFPIACGKRHHFPFYIFDILFIHYYCYSMQIFQKYSHYFKEQLKVVASLRQESYYHRSIYTLYINTFKIFRFIQKKSLNSD